VTQDPAAANISGTDRAFLVARKLSPERGATDKIADPGHPPHWSSPPPPHTRI